MKKPKHFKSFPLVLYAYLDPEGDYVFAETSLEDIGQTHLVGKKSALIAIYDLRSTHMASSHVTLYGAQ